MKFVSIVFIIVIAAIFIGWLLSFFVPYKEVITECRLENGQKILGSECIEYRAIPSTITYCVYTCFSIAVIGCILLVLIVTGVNYNWGEED